MLSNGKGVKWRRSLAQPAKWSFCPTAGKAKGETKRRVRLVHPPAFAAKVALEPVKSGRNLHGCLSSSQFTKSDRNLGRTNLSTALPMRSRAWSRRQPSTCPALAGPPHLGPRSHLGDDDHFAAPVEPIGLARRKVDAVMTYRTLAKI